MGLKLAAYAVLSIGALVIQLLNIFSIHEQFYPALVALCSDKVSLAIIYNFLFMLFLIVTKMVIATFLGTLREVEIEQLIDGGRAFLADTILFLAFYSPTIDNADVPAWFHVQYVCAILVFKIMHLIAQIRVNHNFEVGIPKFSVNVKLFFVMSVLLGLDMWGIQVFLGKANEASTFYSWVLFEILSMVTSGVTSMIKFFVHLVDIRLDNGWPGKTAYLFFMDMFSEIVTMSLFLAFMTIFFLQNPARLPIYMMADIFKVARQVSMRLRSFRKYRAIVSQLKDRFPDGTDAELEMVDTCIICREALYPGAKKLPCGHIFHMDCLKCWLVVQQCCPTCRSDIPTNLPKIEQPPPPPQAAPAPAPRDLDPIPGRPAAAREAVPGAAQAAPPAPDNAGVYVHETPRVQGPVAGAAAAEFAPVAGSAGRESGVQFQATIPTRPEWGPRAGVAAGAAAGVGVVPEGMPTVQEIFDAMQYSQKMCLFLQEQAEFWHQTLQSMPGSVDLPPGRPPAMPASIRPKEAAAEETK